MDTGNEQLVTVRAEQDVMLGSTPVAAGETVTVPLMDAKRAIIHGWVTAIRESMAAPEGAVEAPPEIT